MPVTATQMPLPVAAPPEPIEWLRRQDETEAHAFLAVNGPGWLRSKCRRIPLTIKLDPDEQAPRCRECVAKLEAPR